MKLVLTGALGHIGSALIRSLPVDFPDAEIVMIDDMSVQRYCSLFDLPQSGRYRFIEGDVLKLDLDPIFAGAHAVIHLAAITNAAGSFENAAQVEMVNFDGTVRVAEAASRAGARLLFPSTTSVYGSQANSVDEDCPIEELKPQSPYAEAKLRSEQYLADFVDLPSVTCRFGTIFGVSPGMRFHTAVNKFCWQAVMGQPITVWRTALDQYRPYLDLEDACRSVTFFLQEDLFDRRVYNVVTTNETVGGILDVLRQHVPDLQIALTDTAIMNQLSYHVQNVRVAARGFQFQGDIREGIAATVARIRRANLAVPASA